MSLSPRFPARPARPVETDIYVRGARASASTSHPIATQIAMDVLNDGGSAADAYVAAAFAQTVLEPDMTTLAGTFVVNYWDAKSGSVAFAGSAFSPPAALRDDGSHAITTDGRAVLIPGFTRGAWNVHQKWGRLPWKRVLEPAIAIAQGGFAMDWSLWGHMYQYLQWYGRTEEGRALWVPSGSPIAIGETWRQPALAKTLTGIRDEGPDYMYVGPWGRKFVDTVCAHNGLVTNADMTATEAGVFTSPEWKPGSGGAFQSTTYRGYEVSATCGLLALALNLVEAADLTSRGRPTESSDTLYLLMRIAQQVWHSAPNYGPQTHNAFTSKDYARSLLPLIEHGPALAPIGFRIGTCALAITDADGNIATGTHSVSSSPFGVGYCVDGVVLNRGIHIMRLRQGIAGLNSSALLLKNGAPYLAAATPSRSFFEALLQHVTHLVEFDMGMAESVTTPRFGGADEHMQLARIEADFAPNVRSDVAKRGIQLFEVAPLDYQCGSIHSIRFNGSDALEAVADPRRRGAARAM